LFTAIIHVPARAGRIVAYMCILVTTFGYPWTALLDRYYSSERKNIGTRRPVDTSFLFRVYKTDMSCTLADNILYYSVHTQNTRICVIVCLHVNIWDGEGRQLMSIALRCCKNAISWADVPPGYCLLRLSDNLVFTSRLNDNITFGQIYFKPSNGCIFSVELRCRHA